MTSLLLLSWLFCLTTTRIKHVSLYTGKTLDVRHIRKRALGYSEIDITRSVSPKMCPPPPSFPPLLGKQRQQISLLLCQSLRTTLGQPWDCPPEFPWTSLTFSFSAEGSGHCASTCFCGNWWNDGFVRHCPGNQEKRAWGWARRRWGSWGLGGGEGPLDLEGPLLRRGLEGT